ncbi:hypothetical protein [Oceanithermus sp.]
MGWIIPAGIHPVEAYIDENGDSWYVFESYTARHEVLPGLDGREGEVLLTIGNRWELLEEDLGQLLSRPWPEPAWMAGRDAPRDSDEYLEYVGMMALSSTRHYYEWLALKRKRGEVAS